ncbi:MAG: hypothetical protein IT222_01535 [Crocinitomix sp.]|nr:hypothetical protein [Crocinitomix sp.]
MTLETKAVREGTEIAIAKGSKYFIYEAEKVIGATSGKETKFIRVELNSAGEFHGHPITREKALEYLSLKN